MAQISEPPKRDEIVRVRTRQYLVEEVIAPTQPDDAHLVRLSCVDDDAQGQPLEVLWEREVDPERLRAESWNRIAERGFDPPELFSAYVRTIRWNAVTATDPKLFQSPFRAGIQLHAYQLEPLRKALLLPRVNLFIADDVGLGKTIEAGLIARELLLRKRVSTIVIATPPSVLLQWKDEMETRFGLSFEVLDRDYMVRIRRERGYSTNPWTTHARFLVSHRLLVDETYAGPLRDWLGLRKPASLLILDEAHNAAPSSGGRYAIDSKLTRAVEDLAARFENRLFLSATPHNGHSNSFSRLLEMLDPQRFCRGVKVAGRKVLDDVMVRRLKDDIREVEGGFPKRNIVQVDIDGLPEDAPELVLARLLDRYRALREERLTGDSRRTKVLAGLLVTGLQQRLLSSIEAFARTLRVHRRTVERYASEAERASSRALGALDLLSGGIDADDERAGLGEEDLQFEADAQVEAASRATLGPSTGVDAERKLLDEMAEIADAARGLPDARVTRLIAWIRENQCPAETWNDRRLLIFTEYDDTKRYLREQLEAAIASSDRADERIEIFHGPTPPAKREDLKRAFLGDPALFPVRILIATDAAREGVNLQARCHDLFHFDVPWNPSRLEQRNGRIDRKLQPADEVFCHYFFYKQRPEDRVLQVLVRKTDVIRRELGSLSKVLESRLAATLKGGIRQADAARMAARLDAEDLDPEFKATVSEELEESRQRQAELKADNDVLRDRLAEAKSWIGLEESHLRAALDGALRLVGGDALKATAHDGGASAFVFPALDARSGADSSWADTMDTLRSPRKRDQKPWDWRREAPIRPVVFEAPKTMRDDVVQLHLEHRVVQRLLGRFVAQGFVHHDLSRACLAQSADPIPRVVLLGRLALYGNGAARLHEVLVAVTARWLEPSERKEGLKPYGREAELKTLDLLDQALKAGADREIDKVVRRKLQAAAPGDVAALVPMLEARAKEIGRAAGEKLHERGEREATAMVTLLEAQRKRVLETIKGHDDRQLALPYDDPDEDVRRQLRANRLHWDKRLAGIEAELVSEPRRIREVYEVRATRIEPIGLVYLWPVTG